MAIDTSLDPVAIYAAVLSTALALAQLYLWVMSGPRVSAEIINPLEVQRFDRRLVEVIVHNVSTTPVIIRQVHVSYSERRRGQPLKSTIFDSNANWDPSLKSVAHPTKPNNSSQVANVILPGHEHHELIRPFSEFDPTRHWLQVSVTLRNSRKQFNGFAAPVKGTAT